MVKVAIGDVCLDLHSYSHPCVSDSGLEYLNSLGLEAITLNAEDIDPACRGRIILFFVRDADGQLSHKKKNGTRLRLATDFIPAKALAAFSGNRITVNGFTMSLKNASRLLGTKNSVPMVVDLDVPSDDSLTFSASREKIVGNGKFWVRSLISKLISGALKKHEAFERLIPETKAALVKSFSRCESISSEEIAGFDPTLEDIDPTIVTLVEVNLPTGVWPVGMHQELASKLHLPASVVYKIVSYLRANKRRDSQLS